MTGGERRASGEPPERAETIQLALTVLRAAVAGDHDRTAADLARLLDAGAYGLRIGIAVWVDYTARATGIDRDQPYAIAALDRHGRVIAAPDRDPRVGPALWAARVFAAVAEGDAARAGALIGAATNDPETLLEGIMVLLDMCVQMLVTDAAARVSGQN